MPSSPTKRSRPRSSSVGSDSSTNSFPDLEELNSTPIKPKLKPELKGSPRKVQKRDCVYGSGYTPSPGMDARIKIFAKEIADDLSKQFYVSANSHNEVVATQEVVINMEIRVTTVEGKESITSEIDARLSQEIDVDATHAKMKATDNGDKIKEEEYAGSSSLMGGMDSCTIERERAKEDIDDGDGAVIKVEK